mgnify:CR=1 FL=1
MMNCEKRLKISSVVLTLQKIDSKIGVVKKYIKSLIAADNELIYIYLLDFL